MEIFVKKNVSTDPQGKIFSSLKEALEWLPGGEEEKIIINIDEGEYRERINLKHSNIVLRGVFGKTKITSDEYAYRILKNGEKVGTFRTQTFMADCDNILCENIIFENSAGQGKIKGQAIALYADGQRQIYRNCSFLGYQDTVFTAPLPLKEIKPGGFKGEKEFAPRRDSSILFENCRIEGNIDYIFGGGKCYFKDCVLFTRKREDEGKCFVTAASTPENNEYGYVFDNCRFLTDGPEGSVYLGRPWRNYAKTVILNSYMDEGIVKEGFDDWGKMEARKTLLYGEYKNFGPGSNDKRAEYAIILSDSESKKYTREKVLGF